MTDDPHCPALAVPPNLVGEPAPDSLDPRVEALLQSGHISRKSALADRIASARRESEPVADLQKIKQNAVRSLVHARAAELIDQLAEGVLQRVPETETFTRDELVELLRGASQRMWEEV